MEGDPVNAVDPDGLTPREVTVNKNGNTVLHYYGPGDSAFKFIPEVTHLRTAGGYVPIPRNAIIVAGHGDPSGV